MENEIVAAGQTTFLSPAANLGQLHERYRMFNQFVRDILRAGIDYQVIPGTDKPSLVKPGAEKLATLFGLSARFVVVDKIEDWPGDGSGGEPFFYYVYRCELYRGDLFVASCDGSCNSREKKYRYRYADIICPICGKNNIRKSKNGDGWYCWQKTSGCGATFSPEDQRILDQPRGLIPNPDIADQVNTLQKMAQKRAFVGAVLIATNASEYFTQDIEEMPGFIEAEFTSTELAVSSESAAATGSTNRFWPASALKLLIAKQYAKNEFEARGMLDKSTLPDRPDSALVLAWARSYRAARDAGQSPDEAAAVANQAYHEYLVRPQETQPELHPD